LIIEAHLATGTFSRKSYRGLRTRATLVDFPVQSPFVLLKPGSTGKEVVRESNLSIINVHSHIHPETTE